MNLLRSFLAAAIGFTVAVVILYPVPIRAKDAKDSGTIFVMKATIDSFNVPTHGKEVVGFSCVPHSGGEANCYIALR